MNEYWKWFYNNHKVIQSNVLLNSLHKNLKNFLKISLLEQ
jgi:hypothetical protein